MRLHGSAADAQILHEEIEEIPDSWSEASSPKTRRKYAAIIRDSWMEVSE
jgi:hypothetical protein